MESRPWWVRRFEELAGRHEPPAGEVAGDGLDPEAVRAEVRRAEELVAAASAYLLAVDPFWGFIANSVRYKSAHPATCPTAATDGRRVLYNPHFVVRLKPHEVLGLVLHEVYHVAAQHVLRYKEADPHLWNLATDAVINHYIERLSHSPDGRGIRLPEGGVTFASLYEQVTDEVTNKSEEEVYVDLLARAESVRQQGLEASDLLPPGDGQGDAGAGSPSPQDTADGDDGDGSSSGTQPEQGKAGSSSSDTGDDDGKGSPSNARSGQEKPGSSTDGDADGDGSPSDTQSGQGKPGSSSGDTGDADGDGSGRIPGIGSVRADADGDMVDEYGRVVAPKPASTQQIEREVGQMVADAAASVRDAGKLPAGIRRALERFQRGRIDWRRLLRGWISRARQPGYGWRRLSNRSWTTGVAFPGPTPAPALELVVAVDASGSITEDEIATFLGEIAGLLTAFRGAVRIRPLSFDTEVHAGEAIEPHETLVRLDGRRLAERLNVTGGGGTAFAPVFEYVAARPELREAIVVVFTDGYPVEDDWAHEAFLRARLPGKVLFVVTTDARPQGATPRFVVAPYDRLAAQKAA